LAPRAIGVPLAFSLATAALSSSNVVGGAVTPAFWNRFLLYQKPPGRIETGTAYDLPSIWPVPRAASPIACFVSGVMSAVMSLSWPASTIAAIFPPPRCRKMSGAEPELSEVCSLPSRSSFWTD
jgi:hypothetical protein